MTSQNSLPANIKASLLSHGLDFDLDLFRDVRHDFYENQFVYNQTSKNVTTLHRFPQVLCLGSQVISALLRRPGSPWSVVKRPDDTFYLSREGAYVSDITLPERPAYFGKRLSDGTLTDKFIAVAGEQIPGFFLYPDCVYFPDGVPCSFCSLRGTRKGAGKEMASDFQLEQVAEATRLFQGTKWRDIPIISVTTGTFPNNDNGARYTSRIVRAMYDALEPKIPIHLLTMPPDDFDLIWAYKEAGVTTIAFNLEVYDRDAFTTLCPGKDRFYGYEKMLQALDAAREVFGDYNVFCGFIWGLEDPASTIAGYHYFLDRGMSVSSNVFHADPKSVLASHPHPSEDVVLGLCRSQSDLYLRFPDAKTIFPVSMRSTLDFEIMRGDFR